MRRDWDLTLPLPRDATGTIASRIVRAIIAAVEHGRLMPGDALPASRELARQLGVNRKSVVTAYDDLCAQGWTVSRARHGTFVAELPALRRARATPTPAAATPTLAPLPELQGALLWPPAPGPRFDDGCPDPRLIPGDAIAAAYAAAARHAAAQGRLGYGDPRGTPELRAAVARMLTLERGLRVDADAVCITRGSQGALHALALALVAPGDAVVFESLTYPPAVHAVRLAGGEPLAVPVTDDGLDLDALETLCRTRPVRAVYVTPHHQFPTTVLLQAPGRLRLLELARTHGFLVIEDDYDHDFHFAHEPVFPLRTHDATGHVVYVGSFSKMLAPSLRAGYVVASPAVLARVASRVSVIDRQGDPIAELALAALVEEGRLRRHVREVHARYAERRRYMLTALDAILGDRVTCHPPPGGLALWITVRGRLAPGALASALARAAVACLTSDDCRVGPGDGDGIRLGFASLTAREMDVGLDRLRTAIDLARAATATSAP